MEALILLVAGVMNITCFLVGAKIGRKVTRGEEIKLPSVKGPMEVIRERKDRQKADKEREKVDAIVRNIERYDGTATGQEEVPR